MEVIMKFETKNGNDFQLWKEVQDNETIFAISSYAIPLVDLCKGCYWCVCFEKLSDAVSAMSEIIKNSEHHNGLVDVAWLITKYGKGTC